MEAKDVNEELVGKRCKCIFTGLMVTGTIEEIKIGNTLRRSGYVMTNPTNGETNSMKQAGHLPDCMMTSAHFATLKL